MLLDAELIRTFVAIAESGSFTRAAEIVHRTPSAVSMQVKRLEDMLERSLFIREARSVRLTLDGEKLLGYGRRILSLNDETLAQFTGSRLHGRIRLGAPDDFGVRFLPNILARFASSHPEVDVDVVLAPSLRLASQFKSRKLDLALVTIQPSDTNESTSQMIFTEPLIWVGLKGGRAFQSDRLPLALANHGCAWRDMAMRALDNAGRNYRVAYTSEQSVGQMAAVMADLAIAPLPTSLFDNRFDQLSEAEGLPILGHYHIIMQRTLDRNEIKDALADHVIESFGEMRHAMPQVTWRP